MMNWSCCVHRAYNFYHCFSDWGGLRYKPVGFLEVSSPYQELLLLCMILFYVSEINDDDNNNDDDDDDDNDKDCENHATAS